MLISIGTPAKTGLCSFIPICSFKVVMADADTPDTNPYRMLWFLYGGGFFTHKGHAEQQFEGAVSLPKKLKPKRELDIAKGIITAVQNFTAACSA